MGAVERSLETLPTERLCLVLVAQCLHYIEAYLLHSNGIQPGLFSSIALIAFQASLARFAVQKSPRDFSRHPWHSLGRFALLRDERINVALGICNFLQG